jgi:two-component system response regulator FixJ
LAYVVSADHAVARAIARVAEHVGFEATVFSNPQAFARCQHQLCWGVAVIDLGLPDNAGLNLLRSLSTTGSNLLPIATSDSPSVRLAVEAMRIGAFHYLPRPLMTGELEAALHEGHLALGRRRQEAAQRGLASESIKALSRRQREVLRGLAYGETNATMAARLGLSARTVEGHRRTMMNRLGASHISEAVRLAVTAGLVPAS